jgi:hypothetical protein
MMILLLFILALDFSSFFSISPILIQPLEYFVSLVL